MVQMTLKIDGMQCGMCESHVNDTLRAAFPLKKVSSSHSKGETVLVTAEEIPEDALHRALEPTGYKLKRRYAPRGGVAYRLFLWGFPKGQRPHLAQLCEAKCSVLYALSALP